jgi:hypothetical protein
MMMRCEPPVPRSTTMETKLEPVPCPVSDASRRPRHARSVRDLHLVGGDIERARRGPAERCGNTLTLRAVP